MAAQAETHDQVFRLSSRITLLPVLHGSGDIAQEVRETLISRRFDCLAVPLPPSFEAPLESAVEDLPRINVVTQAEPDAEDAATVNFVPVDPCQAVIMGLRVAMGEGIARAYIDREVRVFDLVPFVTPDPYALKRAPLAAFASALVPRLETPQPGSQQDVRIGWMAFRLHELELDFESILCLCHVADWPWIRAAYKAKSRYRPPERVTSPARAARVLPETLYFALGELPFITQLYEERRAGLRSDRHLSIDGIKELLLETRAKWDDTRRRESQSLINWVTPQLLQLYLQYVRNLALTDRRLTPDLYTLVLAAKQMAGDQFAITLLETAKSYAFQVQDGLDAARSLSMGIGQLEFPDEGVVKTKNRLQGPPMTWRTLSLRPKPTPQKTRRWGLQWNPFRQCSWPPEDDKIESFTGHVREQARAILGADLARTEKFSTSFKDGIDLRETLRHWYGGATAGSTSCRSVEIYVKELPPARGNVDAVVFLFDTPADPEQYSWRATWYAEHDQESTLCFFATPFQDRMIAPGIAQARYGGAFFLFPPRMIPDIWGDPRLRFAESMEERLIGGAALHAQERHIAVVSPIRPRSRWRRIARIFNRRLVMIPLSRFSGQTVDRLRRFHVLNGQEIRSYASKFIRE